MFLEPMIESRRRARHHRKQRELVYDSIVQRRRFEEYYKLIGRQPVVISERTRDSTEHFNRESIRAFVLQQRLKSLRQQPVSLHEIDAPNHAIYFVVSESNRSEVHRDKR